ncbi:MAG: hypothetical protein KY460_07885, partial [Actinobacteria bacterium]|nr:hypothetical protein [Actinomycetota bacterium]
DWLWRADVPSVASGLLTLAIVVLLATTTLLERRASVALAVAALTLLVLGAVRGSSAPTTRGATTACVC